MPKNPNIQDEIVLRQMSAEEKDQQDIGWAVKRYVEIKEEVEEKKKALADAKERFESHKEEMFELMERLGWSSLKAQGHTIYLHRQIWVRHAGDKLALYDALRKAGHEELVYETTNANQLSAMIREKADDLTLENDGIPPSIEEILASLDPALRDTLKITERHDVRSKRS